MHRFTPQWPKNSRDRKPVLPSDFTYRDALDVVHYAEQEQLSVWYTRPDVWHLDREGRWHCSGNGSSLDSIQRYAERPDGLLECRWYDPRPSCPDYWVIVEPRQLWLRSPVEVTEADAAAFVSVRRTLVEHGITLLDAVVLTDDFRWWSLHELTSGTTKWSFTPAVRPR